MPGAGQERIIACVVGNSGRDLALGGLTLLKQNLARGIGVDVEQLDHLNPVLEAHRGEGSDRLSSFEREPVVSLRVNRAEIIRLAEKEFPAKRHPPIEEIRLVEWQLSRLP